ncbi:MAG: acyltransferase family protein [Candidatus Acidiferrales bacterium]
MGTELPKPSRSWSRIDGIDVLRGLAILFVLMNHVNMRLFSAHIPYTHGMPPQLARSLFWSGQFGVQIFFVVSGFLITSIALRRWRSLDHVKVRDFYLLRFARIAPLMLLLLAVLSALHFAHWKDFVVSAKTGGLGRALFAALTVHVNVLEASRGYLPANWDVLWSLSVEEMFYLFFPLVARILGRGKLFIAVLVTFTVLGPFGRTLLARGNPVWREYSYLGGMDAIALGCLTALLVSRTRFSRTALRIFTAIGIALLVLILGFSAERFMWGLGRKGLGETILALGTCLIIIAAAQTQWRSPRFLSPLLNIGQRSYEVYLTHMFVVFALFDIFLKLRKRMLLVPVLFVVAIVLAALLGDLVGRFYSEPMNRLLRARWGEGAKNLGSVVDVESRDEQVAAV